MSWEHKVQWGHWIPRGSGHVPAWLLGLPWSRSAGQHGVRRTELGGQLAAQVFLEGK